SGTARPSSHHRLYIDHHDQFGRESGNLSSGRRLLLGMAKRLIRRYDIADQLLQFGDVRKPALLLPRPDEVSLDPDDEDAPGPGHQRNPAELFLEGGEKLLRH